MLRQVPLLLSQVLVRRHCNDDYSFHQHSPFPAPLHPTTLQSYPPHNHTPTPPLSFIHSHSTTHHSFAHPLTSQNCLTNHSPSIQILPTMNRLLIFSIYSTLPTTFFVIHLPLKVLNLPPPTPTTFVIYYRLLTIIVSIPLFLSIIFEHQLINLKIIFEHPGLHLIMISFLYDLLMYMCF